MELILWRVFFAALALASLSLALSMILRRSREKYKKDWKAVARVLRFLARIPGEIFETLDQINRRGGGGSMGGFTGGGNPASRAGKENSLVSSPAQVHFANSYRERCEMRQHVESLGNFICVDGWVLLPKRLATSTNRKFFTKSEQIVLDLFANKEVGR
jgi:hypothetical protein